MRLKIFLASVFIFAVALNSLQAETCYCYKKVMVGMGQFEWDNDAKACPLAGFDCQRMECSDLQLGDINPVPDGYILNLTLVTVEFKLKDEYGNWNTYIRPGSNYTFDQYHSIEISSCPAYPHLNGRTINLNGITTDGSGNYSVFIPETP